MLSCTYHTHIFCSVLSSHALSREERTKCEEERWTLVTSFVSSLALTLTVGFAPWVVYWHSGQNAEYRASLVNKIICLIVSSESCCCCSSHAELHGEGGCVRYDDNDDVVVSPEASLLRLISISCRMMRTNRHLCPSRTCVRQSGRTQCTQRTLRVTSSGLARSSLFRPAIIGCT